MYRKISAWAEAARRPRVPRQPQPRRDRRCRLPPLDARRARRHRPGRHPRRRRAAGARGGDREEGAGSPSCSPPASPRSGAEGEKLQRQARGARRRRATCTCSGPTPTSTPSRSSATTCPAGDRADHPERPPGPADLPGPGARHPPVALGADRQRGRPRVRRLRRLLRRPGPTSARSPAYIEGFKDGRTLLLAADHAARNGVPDRVRQGRAAPTRAARWPRPTPATSPAPTR